MFHGHSRLKLSSLDPLIGFGELFLPPQFAVFRDDRKSSQFIENKRVLLMFHFLRSDFYSKQADFNGCSYSFSERRVLLMFYFSEFLKNLNFVIS